MSRMLQLLRPPEMFEKDVKAKHLNTEFIYKKQKLHIWILQSFWKIIKYWKFVSYIQLWVSILHLTWKRVNLA